MPSAFQRFTEDDASKFVDPTLFGAAAIYTPAGQGTPVVSYPINVSFADPELDAFDVQASGADDTAPTAMARAEDVPNPRRGDLLEVAGTPYTVRSAYRDGFGHVVLSLAAEGGLTQPGDVLNLATGYVGTGALVPLNWDPDPDPLQVAKRTAIQVWRTDEIAATAPVLVASLGPSATGYNDTTPAPAAYTYEVICLGQGGRSPGAFISVEVQP